MVCEIKTVRKFNKTWGELIKTNKKKGGTGLDKC